MGTSMGESSRLRQLARWNLSSTVRSLLLLILTLLPGPAEAQTYRWVDEHGRVHLTQGLESIPERHRSRARLLDLGPVPPSPAPGYKLYSPPIAPERRPSPAPPWPTKWEPSGPLPEITRVSFPRGSRILIDVKINGQGPVKLLLDTGASRTAVSAQAVRALGISAPSYPCRSCETKYIGGAVEVDEVQILSLRVGEAEMTGPVFIENGDSHFMGAVGILGRSFLDNFRMTIDSRRQGVTLVPATISDSGKHEPSFAPAHVTRIPFPPHPKILVSGTINGRGPIALVLDTAASNTWLAAGVLRRLGISTENAQSRTWQGHAREVRIVDMNVDTVEVAGIKVGPLRISVFVEMETTISGFDGLLGLDFLQNFTVTIDPIERVVTLEGPDA
ncbi:MAG: retroviral-like aspartic protease family protein [Candidatus Rokubacteria bacterium]|nr:retroviral-like aspartic protease family protein [Candidatus Rokubacteria bacterium]